MKLLNIATIVMALTFCNTVGCQNTPEPTAPKVVTTNEQEQLLQDIGEMLLVGFRGTTISDKSHIVRDITQYHVGSIILFEYDSPTGTRHRNIQSPSQLKSLCNDLQKYGEGKLLIGVDQEGGNVTRLRAKDGFPTTLTAQASATAGNSSVENNALTVAKELQKAGINLNFAPCVDVNTNPQCPIIGKLGRSFSSNPDTVTLCARIWLDVQRKYGIVSCLKHYPGHGSASGDTHIGLVDVTKTWCEAELKPYHNLISDGNVEMIMVAHVINRQLGDELPASLSPIMVKEKLRNDLGFKGVIVTDDLAMGAITKQYGFEEALKMAILAGCDMLCLSNNGASYNSDMVPHAVETIVQFVNNGEISASDIHDAAERVRALKRAHSIQ